MLLVVTWKCSGYSFVCIYENYVMGNQINCVRTGGPRYQPAGDILFPDTQGKHLTLLYVQASKSYEMRRDEGTDQVSPDPPLLPPTATHPAEEQRRVLNNPRTSQLTTTRWTKQEGDKIEGDEEWRLSVNGELFTCSDASVILNLLHITANAIYYNKLFVKIGLTFLIRKIKLICTVLYVVTDDAGYLLT